MGKFKLKKKNSIKADVHLKGAAKLFLFMEGKNSAGLGVSALAAKKTTKKLYTPSMSKSF